MSPIFRQNHDIHHFSLRGKIKYGFLASYLLAGFGLSITAGAFRSGDLEFAILDKNNVEVVRPSEGEEYAGENYVIPGKVEFEGSNYNVVGIGYKAFCGFSEIKEVTFPETLEWIGDDAFSGCTALGPKLEFRSNVIIGNGAFSYCRGIRELDLSDHNGSIGESAFMGCTNLSSVTFYNGMELVPEFSFKDCLALSRLELPLSTKEIGEQAFSGCTGLSEITIPPSIEVIGDRAFSNCSSTKSLSLACHQATIGDGCFEHLQSLESLFLTGISKVGESAFEDCRSMKWVEIDHCTESLGRRAFAGCNLLETVYCHPENPPMIFQDTFDSSTESKAWLMVSEGSSNRYEMSAYWSRFDHIEETAIFPVSVRDIMDNDTPKLSIGRGELKVKYHGTPRLTSLSGESQISERYEGCWIFHPVTGIYVLTYDGRSQKIMIK